MTFTRIATWLSCACLIAWTGASYAAMTHRYSFNDGTADDSIGGVNGTLINGAAVSAGQLMFDPAVNNGTNTNPTSGQYLQIPSNILHTPAFSIEAWFTQRGGAPWQRILDFGNSIPNPTPPPQGNIGHGFIILTPRNSQGNVLGQISINSWGNPSDTDYVTSPVPISLGVEHQVVYTHDPAAHLERLYVDGLQVSQAAARVDPSTATYSNFWLGRSQFTQDPFFDGSIDELRIYDAALSPAQVAADHQLGPNAVPEPVLPTLGIVVAGLMIRRRR